MAVLNTGMDRRSRSFLALYTRSLFALRYRYTYFGVLWNALEPALYLVVLSAIFSVVNRMNVASYAVYLFSALIPWRFLERSVGTAMESIVGGEWLLRRLPVSSLVFPLSRWMLGVIELLISFGVALLLMLFIKPHWTRHLLVLPVAMIPWAILALGCGLITAVLFVFFRDIRPLVQFGLMVVFFTSPILFHRDLFAPHSFQARALAWHPMTYFAALFQKPIYAMSWPSAIDWGVSLTVSLATLGLGLALHERFKSRFYYYL